MQPRCQSRDACPAHELRPASAWLQSGLHCTERPRMSDILIGRNDTTDVSLQPRYGNRHGMVAGATGTGKSVSLMVLAEGFSRLGVSCVLADVKGDLAGLALPASEPGDKIKARLSKLRLTDWQPQANPVIFWDLYGKRGHPLRTTMSERSEEHTSELQSRRDLVCRLLLEKKKES